MFKYKEIVLHFAYYCSQYKLNCQIIVRSLRSRIWLCIPPITLLFQSWRAEVSSVSWVCLWRDRRVFWNAFRGYCTKNWHFLPRHYPNWVGRQTPQQTGNVEPKYTCSSWCSNDQKICFRNKVGIFLAF